MKKKNSAMHFDIFVFRSQPQIEKIEIIDANQGKKIICGDFLKCISINLLKQSVVRHYKSRKSSFGIEDHLNNYFNVFIDEILKKIQ